MSSDTDNSSQLESESGHVQIAVDVAAAYTRGPARVLFKGKHFHWRPHEDNTRAFTKSSIIWQLGDEYKRREGDRKQYWRYSIYKKNTILVINNGSSSGLRYLRKKHKIDSHGQRIRRNSAFSSTIPSPFEVATTIAAIVINLVTRFNFLTFRYLFIR